MDREATSLFEDVPLTLDDLLQLCNSPSFSGRETSLLKFPFLIRTHPLSEDDAQTIIRCTLLLDAANTDEEAMKIIPMDNIVIDIIRARAVIILFWSMY